MARLASGWTVEATTTAPRATIPWRAGVTEHAIFAVLPTGEAVELARFRTGL